MVNLNITDEKYNTSIIFENVIIYSENVGQQCAPLRVSYIQDDQSSRFKEISSIPKRGRVKYLKCVHLDGTKLNNKMFVPYLY